MAKILVEIVGDAKKFKSELGSAGRDAEQFGGKIRSHASGAVRGLGIAAAGAAVVGVGLLAKGLMDGVKTAIEHQKALAQTNAVIKSTGGSANVNAAHILKLSDSIEKMSGMDDLAVQSGENMLLTFKNIKNGTGAANKIFDQSTKVLADMTVALGSDPQKQAIQLGKALNDPVKGISALARVGVTFTEQQKKNIAAMVEHGHTAEAQKVILKELQSEFGGSAKAAGETMGGQLNILKAHLEDVEQTIGEKILPVLNQLIQWAITNWPTFSKYAKIAFENVQNAITFLTPYFFQIKTAVETVVAAVRAHWTEISAIIKSVVDVIRTQLNLFGDLIHGRWSKIWDDVVEVVKSVGTLLVNVVKLIGPLLLAALEAVGKKALEGLEKGLQALPGVLLAGLKALPGLALTAAELIGEAIVKGIKWAVPHLASLAGDLMGKIHGEINSVAGQALSAAEEIGRSLVQGIVNGLGNLASAVGDKLSSGLHGAVGIGKSALGISSPSTVAADQLGKPIAEGVIQGWLAGSATLPSTLSQGLQNAITAGRAKIESAKATFQTAWSQVAAGADAAFDKMHASILTKTEKLIAAMQTAAQKAQLKGALSAAQGQLASAQAGATPLTGAAKDLADLQSAHEDAARRQALDAANAKAAAATTLEEAAAAQQAIADATYNITVADLTRKAAAQQAAADQTTAITNAQQAVAAANQAISDAAAKDALDKRAANERVQLDARTALQKTHFDDALTKLQTHLANGHASYAEAHKAILKLFKRFGVNYSDAGAELGAAFVTGLRDSIQEAAGKSGALSGRLEGVAAGIHVPHAATGGFVAQTGLAVIHQGETITPAGRGGNVNVTINGYVSNEHLEQLRNLLIRTGRNTTGGALGRFA